MSDICNTRSGWSRGVAFIKINLSIVITYLRYNCIALGLGTQEYLHMLYIPYISCYHLTNQNFTLQHRLQQYFHRRNLIWQLLIKLSYGCTQVLPTLSRGSDISVCLAKCNFLIAHDKMTVKFLTSQQINNVENVLAFPFLRHKDWHVSMFPMLCSSNVIY